MPFPVLPNDVSVYNFRMFPEVGVAPAGTLTHPEAPRKEWAAPAGWVPPASVPVVNVAGKPCYVFPLSYVGPPPGTVNNPVIVPVDQVGAVRDDLCG